MEKFLLVLFLISLIVNIFLVIKYFKAKKTGRINTDRVDNFFGLFLITMLVLLIFAPSIKANRDLHVNTEGSFNFAVTNMGRVFEKMEYDLFEEHTGEIKDEKIIIDVLRNGGIDFYHTNVFIREITEKNKAISLEWGIFHSIENYFYKLENYLEKGNELTQDEINTLKDVVHRGSNFVYYTSSVKSYNEKFSTYHPFDLLVKELKEINAICDDAVERLEEKSN